MSRVTGDLIVKWNTVGSSVEERLCEALQLIERLHADRLKLDRRIHNQRRACRETWEIVEMRRKWLGSDSARRMYCNLYKRFQALRAQLA